MFFSHFNKNISRVWVAFVPLFLCSLATSNLAKGEWIKCGKSADGKYRLYRKLAEDPKAVTTGPVKNENFQWAITYDDRDNELPQSIPVFQPTVDTPENLSSTQKTIFQATLEDNLHSALLFRVTTIGVKANGALLSFFEQFLKVNYGPSTPDATVYLFFDSEKLTNSGNHVPITELGLGLSGQKSARSQYGFEMVSPKETEPTFSLDLRLSGLDPEISFGKPGDVLIKSTLSNIHRSVMERLGN